MVISQAQTDALAEIIQAGFIHAATSYSKLLRQPVQLEASQFILLPLAELDKELSACLAGEVVMLHQAFNDHASPEALWLLDCQAAVTLIDLLSREPVSPRTLTVSDREALVEVGSILLPICLSEVSSRLTRRPTFAPLRLHLEVTDPILTIFSPAAYGVLFNLYFKLAQGSVEGCVAVALSQGALEALLASRESHPSMGN